MEKEKKQPIRNTYKKSLKRTEESMKIYEGTQLCSKCNKSYEWYDYSIKTGEAYFGKTPLNVKQRIDSDDGKVAIRIGCPYCGHEEFVNS